MVRSIRVGDELKVVESVEDLRNIVDTLSEDIVDALKIKNEKKRLSEEVEKLKKEEIKLKKIVESLDGTTADPLKILKIRLAKGEITKEEYNEIKNELDQ